MASIRTPPSTAGHPLPKRSDDSFAERTGGPTKGGTVAAASALSRHGRAARLYKRFGPIIYARVRRMLRDSAAAEDATQEVFLKVVEHLDAATHDEAALRWIHTVSRNHCLNLTRDGRRESESVAEVPDTPVAALAETLGDLDFTRKLFARVPERVRAAATMFYLEGMEQAAVAKALGVSRRTVLYLLADLRNAAVELAASEVQALKESAR